jgi:hypothetical protein
MESPHIRFNWTPFGVELIIRHHLVSCQHLQQNIHHRIR